MIIAWGYTPPEIRSFLQALRLLDSGDYIKEIRLRMIVNGKERLFYYRTPVRLTKKFIRKVLEQSGRKIICLTKKN